VKSRRDLPVKHQSLSTMSAHALDRIFRALEEHGCSPVWIAGGRGIVADCPSCGDERGLIVEVGSDLGVDA